MYLFWKIFCCLFTVRNYSPFKVTLAAVILINTISLFTLQVPATAQSAGNGTVVAQPALPRAATLRPGRIVRDAAGVIVLQPPVRAAEDADSGEQVDTAPPGEPVTVIETERPDVSAAPQGDGHAPASARASTSPAQVAGDQRQSIAGDGFVHPAQTAQTIGTEPIGEDVSGAPPPGKLKAGVVQRNSAGDLTLAPRTPQELRVCKPQTAQPGCDFLSLADAVAAAQPSDTVLLSKGVYEEAALVTVSGLTIKGEPGAHLKGRAVEGKAALVIRADDVVIEGIECSETRVPDKNGACVRIEGRNLTLRNVYFHDNEEGVLGGVGGTVLVEDSVFERNGARRGYSHGLYIANTVEEFIFRRSKVLSTKDEGQGVKSRAQKTVIEDSVIAGLESRDSRAIDIPNGGDITIRGNVLQKGPNSSNSQMIGLGLEGNLHPNSRAMVENNLIIFDGGPPDWVKIMDDTVPVASPSGTIVFSRMPDVTLKDNAVVGVPRTFTGEGVTESGTHRYPTRSRANLPDYPALPDPGTQPNAGSN